MSNEIKTVLDDLAGFIGYPTPESLAQVPEACRLIVDRFPQLAIPLNTFSEYVQQHSITELEEQYTRSFDFDPDCALELGWHLYGENYGRGDFLVKMRDLLDYCKVSESVELPDHLTYVLAAIGCLEHKQAQEFCQHYIVPAIGKLLKGIASKQSPYEHVLVATHQLLSEVYTTPAIGGVTS